MNFKPLSQMMAFAICLIAVVVRGRAESGSDEFFEARIRPVLAEHCYECHSASAKKVKGGLLVDSREHLLTGGDTGPAIIPGKPDASLLVTAMAHRDKDLAMPPKKDPLPAATVADFEKWIRNGAAWPAKEPTGATAKATGFNLEERKKKFPWVWQTPTKQTIPSVTNASWPRSQEDRFILHRLEEAGLAPATATDDRTWLRRVHFAITGLPPKREEIQAFLADRQPGARERVVDQLLDSPHFGERWARHWMDLMRYAESRGHEGDYIIANAWQYRDYLIRAFNADVPYDRFVQEHLSGDLLPSPRLRPGTSINESVLATGWAFLGEENHSPVDIRQDECERIDNKVDVFSKTFLGLTVACARCHDHKFDPIRSQDYYAIAGFMLGSSFRQVRFEAMENNRAMGVKLASLRAQHMPHLAQLTADSRAAGIKDIVAYLLASRKVISAGASNTIALGEVAQKNSVSSNQLRLWVEHLQRASTNSASPLYLLAKVSLPPDANSETHLEEALNAAHQVVSVRFPAGTRVIADYTRSGVQPWKTDGEAFGNGPTAVGELILGHDIDNPIAGVMIHGAARRDLFWNRLTIAPGNENDSGRLGATGRAGQMLRTPTITLSTGKLHYLIQGKTRAYAAVDSHIMNEGPLHGHLAEVFESGSDKGPRWVTHDLTAYIGHRVHVEFGPEGSGELEILMVVESPETPQWQPPSGVFEPSPNTHTFVEIAREFQSAVATANEVLRRGAFSNSSNVIAQAALANWIVQNPALFGTETSKLLHQAAQDFIAGQDEIARRVQWESRTAVGWFDGTGVDENVLVRGKPFQPGAVSPRSLPAVFISSRPITTTNSSGRYELAQQLVDPENPLVARTMVNRVWHHLYGRGIVATVDNFGALGERPTHPEILDHLTWEFVHEDGWSVKKLIKRLVLMQTYAMSSVASDPRIEELDPSNVLLHRMPVRRLEGEVIRDALLTVSGRLNATVGGPPVQVYLTEFLVGRGRPDKSGPLDGDGRRSVYSAMHRNFLPTLMLAFDAPTPFSTVGRRNVTNVPAQSLALMNDPLFQQQARVWAERLIRESSAIDEIARVRWLFETAYGRLPTQSEIQACHDSLVELADLHHARDVNDLDVWADLCHALLNANDFIYLK